MLITIIFLPFITYVLLVTLSSFTGRGGKFIAVILPICALFELAQYFFINQQTTTIALIGN